MACSPTSDAFLLSIPMTTLTSLHQVVHLTFDKFSLERPTSVGHCFDSLSVYDGEDEEAERIAYECGSDLPGSMTSSRNEMYLVFSSDGTVRGNGFTVTYAAKKESGQVEDDDESPDVGKHLFLHDISGNQSR